MTHLQLRHECLHSLQEYARLLVSNLLLVKNILESWEKRIELSRFYDRPRYNVQLVPVQNNMCQFVRCNDLFHCGCKKRIDDNIGCLAAYKAESF